jgi:hypothetical protein
MKTRRGCVWAILFAALLTASYAVGQVETITTRARGTNTQMGKDVDITINISNYSTSEDRQALKDAFDKGGQEALVKTLNKMKGVGRIRIPSTTGYSLAYVVSYPTPTGRKIRFVTDRPIAFFEARNMTRSQQYDLTCGEIDINDQDKSKSSGVLYPAAKVKLNKEGQIEFELFQNPWKLTNIIDWTKPKE